MLIVAVPLDRIGHDVTEAQPLKGDEIVVYCGADLPAESTAQKLIDK